MFHVERPPELIETNATLIHIALLLAASHHCCGSVRAEGERYKGSIAIPVAGNMLSVILTRPIYDSADMAMQSMIALCSFINDIGWKEWTQLEAAS